MHHNVLKLLSFILAAGIAVTAAGCSTGTQVSLGSKSSSSQTASGVSSVLSDSSKISYSSLQSARVSSIPGVSSKIKAPSVSPSSSARRSSPSKISSVVSAADLIHRSDVNNITFQGKDKKHKNATESDFNTIVSFVNSLPRTAAKTQDSDLDYSINISTSSEQYEILIYDQYWTYNGSRYQLASDSIKKLIAIYDRSPEEICAKKPVLYLYPAHKQDISVKLDFKGQLLNTYPFYGGGWNVTAYPDGRLINKADNQEYSYLFWDGVTSFADWDFSQGYVVAGSDTAPFLQKTLSKMGLTPKEYNDFIVYWLPLLSENQYNLITFQTTAYESISKLNISPKPDSVLRVYMVYKPLDKPVSIKAPAIKPFERKGFTVVEWGGSGIS